MNLTKAWVSFCKKRVKWENLWHEKIVKKTGMRKFLFGVDKLLQGIGEFNLAWDEFLQGVGYFN